MHLCFTAHINYYTIFTDFLETINIDLSILDLYMQRFNMKYCLTKKFYQVINKAPI